MKAQVDYDIPAPLQTWLERRKMQSMSQSNSGRSGDPRISKTHHTIIDFARRSDCSKHVHPLTHCSHLTPRPLTAGQTLGPYRLLCKLGRGAQGDVWKAMGMGTSQGPVALKILKPNLARNPSRMAQFRREAERGIRLMGPALLPVFEVGAADGYHYMAMPFIEGTALSDVFRNRRAFLQGDASDEVHWIVTATDHDFLIAMARTLARAVHALAQVHDLRIVHRDIKPANIMIDQNRPMGVFVCDFGLGRDLEVATPEQMRDGAGTPLYMAPERLKRDLADETLCDIYSMGVTLFEATTLERPFLIHRDVPFSAIPGYLAEAVPLRPTQVRPDFPVDLEAIICKAMARKPADRYQSAHAFAKDLDRFLSASPAASRGSMGERSSISTVHRPHHAFARPLRGSRGPRSFAVQSNVGCLSFVPVFNRGPAPAARRVDS